MPKYLARGAILLMQSAALLLAGLAARVPALAQGETTSAILGSVTDSSGCGDPRRDSDRHQRREWHETIRENGRLGAL